MHVALKQLQVSKHGHGWTWTEHASQKLTGNSVLLNLQLTPAATPASTVSKSSSSETQRNPISQSQVDALCIAID